MASSVDIYISSQFFSTGTTKEEEEEEEPEEMTLEEINKTLTLTYMYDNAPFTLLPRQYLPDKTIHHRPPVFFYGISATLDKLEEYARKQGVYSQDKPLKRGYLRAVAEHLNTTCQLPKGTIAFQTIADDHCDTLVYTCLSNYKLRFPEDKVQQFETVIETIERELGGIAKWYLGESSDFRDDYKVTLK
ncbi:hypothetical protein E1B28_009472 [Marasmius oreades]|uniref:Uncharacterized protein n=1 Tax=Marasmius oreades TaxID=181124 RepID=A0A9P7RVU3_9AGAR|nr:uncharacterized protein E1B28_009472 [Marasmius oreades]KAG7090352.1 hypothetical protein E1B28_009472 [Marasmius oreades]